MGGEGVGRLVKSMVICSFERRVMKTMIIELRDNDRIASSLQKGWKQLQFTPCTVRIARRVVAQAQSIKLYARF